MATRLQKIVVQTGGARIWIKHPATLRAPTSDPPLQVVGDPAACQSVLTALRQEASRDGLRLESTSTFAAGQRSLKVNITRHRQPVIQVNLQEVPRLLRAAIVIDDLGQDLEAARKLLAMQFPLTFSVLPYLTHTRETAEEAHHHGREVMLHLPMEPEAGSKVSPGEGAIRSGMAAAEVRRVVDGDLAAVPFVAGVNNHMGSRATRDAGLMNGVMRVLADRGLYFIDSRTTPASVALDAAERQHVPAFYRAVFLDDTETVSYTLGQLREFRRAVEQEGAALAIGHPHPTTITALEKFLPELESANIQLVAPSEIVRLPEIARLHPPVKPK